MSEDDAPSLPIKPLLHKSARSVHRLQGAYAGLKDVRHSSDKPVSHDDSTGGRTKSYAQVATLVRPRVVRPKSCGLKPNRKRPYRLMGRFSKEERNAVISKATAARLSVNEFIRLSTLETDYAASLNPALRQLFVAVHRELCRQGQDLGRIADHLGANFLSPNETNSMLGMIGWDLMAAIRAVTNALAEGRSPPD